VQTGDSLLAAYANNSSGPGTSGITVQGGVSVGNGGTLILGCEAAAFACFDDPNQNAPTLNSSDEVDGAVTATTALGVLIHNSTVGGDVVQTGGGGGLSCAPSGIFTLFGSPVYSDYEDNTLGSATFADSTFADPDASENVTNTIAGNLLCSGNSPAVHVGDSGGSPNVVSGFATGECTDPSLFQAAATPLGYWLADAAGSTWSFGIPSPPAAGTATTGVVGIAAVPGSGGNFDLARSDGSVIGSGPRSGDCTTVPGPLNRPVVGVAAAPGGNGCWLAAADGGVFSRGSNAPFFGSAGALALTRPVVGIAASAGNDGYDLVASDGGVFTYGPGAQFHGSMGGMRLNQPIVGIATDPTTGGYWLVAADGGIFSFDAPFLGSMGGQRLNAPIVGMAAAPGGDGYYLVAADGGIFTFGPGAHFQGSRGGSPDANPFIGMALG
jgi:hypothetical protein